MPYPTPNRYLARRPAALGLAKVFFLAFGSLPSVQAAPLWVAQVLSIGVQEEGKDAEDPSLWLYLGVAAILVLLGGAFAGLTIALMGQDEMYLQVIKTSGEGAERKHATKVLNLLNKGKHWVLVTLLLSNVITNETLPIVLDRSLGGGWPAVLGSTVLIVIFGEIAPQSVCVRYGLPIGAWMAPFVLGLMYILSPIAWPTAKLLDWLLGEDHGTVYKKTGLKTLVSLHKSIGEPGQQLNTDEVTIISGVLDLKEKSVGSIMTPMENVFTMSLDDVLDEETMEGLLSQGYSRIPIHQPDNIENFVGMLLVKMLITYDPEDAKPVRDFALATLPETAPNTSCLDIVNFFQEGKSHMVLVSSHPGDDHGALGVVTLEDVIEELIGEEIVDESDVFIDVQKALRRQTLAPRTRISKNAPASSPKVNGTVNVAANGDLIDITEGEALTPDEIQRVKTAETAAKPKPVTPAILARRRSSAANSNLGDYMAAKKASTDEIRGQLKHLGPSNLASRPKATRFNTVKIKPGTTDSTKNTSGNERTPLARRISETASTFAGGIGEGVLRSGGKDASDGAQVVQQVYGTSPLDRRPRSAPKSPREEQGDLLHTSNDGEQGRKSRSRSHQSQHNDDSRSASHSTVGSLPRKRSRTPDYLTRGPARSGSITEHTVDANGIRKVVLEPSSSSSDDEEGNSGASKVQQKEHRKSKGGTDSKVSLRGGDGSGSEAENHDSTAKNKRRRKKKPGAGNGEREPLLG